MKRLFAKTVLRVAVFVLACVAIYAWISPPTTWTIEAERRRLGDIARSVKPLDSLGDELPRAVIAAEDARFCGHWGFDVVEIRRALDAGAMRGASTLTQQTVKNAYLWQGRSWARKALEAGLTPLVELVWGKRRILEVYLNIAEFGPGVFGAEAGAQRWFGKPAARLSAREAARLAAVLPAPRERDPTRSTAFLERRAASIADGVATLERRGGFDCLRP